MNAMKQKISSQSGFTLIEVLLVVVIAAIAFLAVSGPFMAERRFWSNGMKKASAQRDAQLIVRSIQKAVRQSEGFTVIDTLDSDTLTLTGGVCAPTFTGGPAQGGILTKTDCNGVLDLVDGGRTKVAEFNVSPIVADKLLEMRIRVVSDMMDEVLETRIYARNG